MAVESFKDSQLSPTPKDSMGADKARDMGLEVALAIALWAVSTKLLPTLTTFCRTRIMLAKALSVNKPKAI